MSAATLYTNKESGNAFKPRLLAALLGIDLKLEEVDLATGGNRSPEYLAINPRGQIPCFVDGDKVLTDSAAILVYLAGKHPDPKGTTTPSSYWSSDAYEQAQIVDWLAFTAGHVAGGVSAARVIACFGAPSTEQTRADANKKALESLEILQATLDKNQWLALGRPTIADIATFVYVALAPMGHISLDPYPAVNAWIERIKQLPGFVSMLGMDDPTYLSK